MQKIVLITGASRGIGKACAEKFARKGIKVIANYNKSEKQAEELKKELKKEGYDIEIYKADMGKREEIRKMVNWVLEKYGKIDILVNNAGISQIKLFTDLTDEDIDNMIDINLKSVFYITREVVKSMVKKQEGNIINISSVWGITGGACEVHYSAVKAGIIGMTKALAKELAYSNIRVNAIAPGIIDTDMNKELNEEEIAELEKEIPLKRMGNANEIANTAYMLLENRYITGQVIQVDGGWIN